MASLPTYSSRLLKINWVAIDFMGLAPDNAVEVNFNADITDEEVGADGSVAISILPDETGTITINLQQNSPTNQALAAVVNGQRLDGSIASSDMTIKDPSGSVIAVARNAHIKGRPTITRGSSATGSTMSWTFFVESLLLQPVTPENSNAASLVADVLGTVGNVSDILGNVGI